MKAQYAVRNQLKNMKYTFYLHNYATVLIWCLEMLKF